MEQTDVFFPYSQMREQQKELIDDIKNSIAGRKCIIVHAPTGLGKTVSAIAPALGYALKNDLNIFFLTSRHTQHQIAVETIREIKDKYNLKFNASSIIGKKWMCLQSVQKMTSSDFISYCKELREKGNCEYYANTKTDSGKPTVASKKLVEDLIDSSECGTENVIENARTCRLCPYEIAISLARKSTFIIADYFYLFNPKISERFFSKINKDVSKSIIIIDEGHNLPKRITELMSERISTMQLVSAIREAKKYNFEEYIRYLAGINDILNKLSKDMKFNDEMLIDRKVFEQEVEKISSYDEIIAELESAGDSVRQVQKKSHIASIASFLEKWKGPDEGFARIISVGKSMNSQPMTVLSYKCLDPSVVSRGIVEKAHSVILMSGTLNPTEMYQDVLGFPKSTMCRNYKNPFPKKNRLNLVVPETTTKFTKRNDEEYKKISTVCAGIVNEVKGNSAIFFPSYFVRDEVARHFNIICKKTIFEEKPGLTKKEKFELLENFKKYKTAGAVLLAVSSGSFGEGINLPNLLKCVIVVGLPLTKPNLETSELIKYYDNKFGRGFDYGYIYPAINKCLQSAGRCIRSETDRGVVIFLDERFAWKIYSRCFPADFDAVVSRDYMKEIRNFFDNQYTQS